MSEQPKSDPPSTLKGHHQSELKKMEGEGFVALGMVMYNPTSNDWALLTHPRANPKAIAHNLRRFADELWVRDALDGCQG